MKQSKRTLEPSRVPSMRLRARRFEYEFPRPTLVMGVLNVTPDSFSDGGLYRDPSHALERARRMVEEGADCIDIGGESSRPKARSVPEKEELRRVLPVVERVVAATGLPVSIDTMKPAVARAALQAGASIINDVAANRDDASMAALAAEFGAGYVLVHMQGTPQTMQDQPHYTNVLEEVDAFFGQRLKFLDAAGVHPEQVILDVGLGFGKLFEHNLTLLGSLERFINRRRPILVGASRKSFIGQAAGGAEVNDRLAGSLACACLAVQAGAVMIRTHDVAATRQAMRVTEAVLSHRTKVIHV